MIAIKYGACKQAFFVFIPHFHVINCLFHFFFDLQHPFSTYQVYQPTAGPIDLSADKDDR